MFGDWRSHGVVAVGLAFQRLGAFRVQLSREIQLFKPAHANLGDSKTFTALTGLLCNYLSISLSSSRLNRAELTTKQSQAQRELSKLFADLEFGEALGDVVDALKELNSELHTWAFDSVVTPLNNSLHNMHALPVCGSLSTFPITL